MTVRTSLLAALSVLILSPASPAWERGESTTFARLPGSERDPEGIALDKKTGDVYVAEFAVGGTTDGMGHVVVFNKEGKVRRVLSGQHSTPLLLGLDFHP